MGELHDLHLTSTSKQESTYTEHIYIHSLKELPFRKNRWKENKTLDDDSIFFCSFLLSME